MKRSKGKILVADILGCLLVFAVFVVPFLFMIVNSLKDRKAANLLSISVPETFRWSNFPEVIRENDYQILTAFKNSLLIAACSVLLLVFMASMAAYTIQRRQGKAVRIINSVFMMGLMIPLSILPTIWLLRTLHIYKTLFSIIMIETTLNLPFSIMLYRGFIGTIPIELEEAALIDGCSKIQLFFRIIFPLLKPVTATAIILNAVTVFNDFTNALYFFPGKENATVQLTLYNFNSKFSSSYNLLFADVVLIIIPMLIVFLIFNKKIVEGMVAGSVKG